MAVLYLANFCALKNHADNHQDWMQEEKYDEKNLKKKEEANNLEISNWDSQWNLQKKNRMELLKFLVQKVNWWSVC